MPVDTENVTIAEHIRLRGPRRPTQTVVSASDPRNPHPKLPSIVQSTSCKSTISSLLLSTFTSNNPTPADTTSSRAANTTGRGNNDSGRKKGFKNSGLRGLGCTAQPEVAVPEAVIRSSAVWEERGERKKNNNSSSSNSKKKKKKKQQRERETSGLEVQDVWCGPGIGFSGFATDDFVASTRPVSGRGKIDVDKVNQREVQRSAYSSSRQRGILDQFADLDLDPDFEIPHSGSDICEARYHHIRSRYPEGLPEIIMLNGIFSGARSFGLDRYRELRLDIENMSYEELLELSDKIGYVSTGLKEDQMGHCIKKTKFLPLDKLSHTLEKIDLKCSICQEEYVAEEETGKLECGHTYHLQCIKQWLMQKNACPVCKSTAAPR